VSASYGPGRYDANYEEKGQDYPVGFVRWTGQRNFEAVLDMMAAGTLDVKPLVSHRFRIDEAADAYKRLDDPTALAYCCNIRRGRKRHCASPCAAWRRLGRRGDSSRDSTRRRTGPEPVVGFVGAGNYASRILIPALRKLERHSILSSRAVA